MIYIVIVGAYIIFLLAFIIYSAFALRQIQRFGYEGDRSHLARVLYISTSLIIIVLSLLYLLIIGIS